MAFQLNTQESIPDLRVRVGSASTEDLEEVVAEFANAKGPTEKQVTYINHVLARRRSKIALRLSWETRIIAFVALALTAGQLYFQIFPPQVNAGYAPSHFSETQNPPDEGGF